MRQVLPVDDQALDLVIRGDQHLDVLVGQLIVLGLGGDQVVGALGLYFEVPKILAEIEFAEQERQRRPHVVAGLELGLLHAVRIGGVEINVLAVGNEKLAGRRL